MRVAPEVKLSDEQRQELEKRARGRTVTVRAAQRAKMILMAARQAWLERHPRFHIHFTPTSASWLNMVERFFRDITQKQIRRGCFANVAQLIETIKTYIAQHN